MIDIKSLVVGQEVYMFSGVYMNTGKVVKVTPSGVDVQTDRELVRFDKDGNETDVGRRDRLGFGPSPESKFHTVLWQFAPEFAPWQLDDIPFAERTASLEQEARKWEAFNKVRAVRIDDKAVDPYYTVGKEQMQELVRRLEQQLAAAKAAVQAM